MVQKYFRKNHKNSRKTEVKNIFWNIVCNFFVHEDEQGATLDNGLPQETEFVAKIGSYHCIKNVHIRSYSGPNFPAFGLNRERYGVSLRIQSICGKIRTRITPNVDAFYQVYDKRSYLQPQLLTESFLLAKRINRTQ